MSRKRNTGEVDLEQRAYQRNTEIDEEYAAQYPRLIQAWSDVDLVGRRRLDPIYEVAVWISNDDGIYTIDVVFTRHFDEESYRRESDQIFRGLANQLGLVGEIVTELPDTQNFDIESRSVVQFANIEEATQALFFILKRAGISEVDWFKYM